MATGNHTITINLDTAELRTHLHQCVGEAMLALLKQIQELDGARLSFDAVRAANKSRAHRWHGPEGLGSWSPLEWASAMAGEAGEAAEAAFDLVAAGLAVAAKAGAAANKAKKLLRMIQGLSGAKNPISVEIARKQLGEECADVFIYLDLLCASQDISLEAAIVSKFNEVSTREGFPEKL